jgi:uncharacterized membrane protein YfcA
VDWTEIAILVAGGIVAGTVNTLAGGASALTVPLLVLVGLPATVANGTNRVGILVQNVVAAWRFRAEGVSGLRGALPALVPTALGALAGAYGVSLLDDRVFERLFGVVMLALVVPVVLGAAPSRRSRRAWSAPLTFLVFLAIGVFGGAVQAGVGFALVFALSWAGYDLVRANSIKVAVNAVLTGVAVPVFVLRGQVAWVPGLVLAAGFALGSVAGVRIAVTGGERVIRPVFAASVLALAGRMLGLY